MKKKETLKRIWKTKVGKIIIVMGGFMSLLFSGVVIFVGSAVVAGIYESMTGNTSVVALNEDKYAEKENDSSEEEKANKIEAEKKEEKESIKLEENNNQEKENIELEEKKNQEKESKDITEDKKNENDTKSKYKEEKDTYKLSKEDEEMLKEFNRVEEKPKYNIKHGEFLDANVNGDILVIKAKIQSSFTNKMTINQNMFNVKDIIQNQGGDKFKEIQYWAVAEMEGGGTSKVISFTVYENEIKLIKDEILILAEEILQNVDDLWILPSLRN